MTHATTTIKSCFKKRNAHSDVLDRKDLVLGAVDTSIRWLEVAKVEERGMGGERTGDPRKVMTSVTPPELSAGQVNMVIEGATQISLRYQIQELKGRLLQCKKDVEDAILLERDLYDSLSLDSDISDNDS